MSDEEVVRQALVELMESNVGSAADRANITAFDRILSDRDSLNSTIAYLQGFWVPERMQELIAERDSLRAALKQRAAASAERVQMDGETIASLRADRDKIRAAWQEQTADWAMKRAQYRKREKMDRELIDSLTADRDSLRHDGEYLAMAKDENLALRADRDSLRAALERIIRTPLDINDEGDAEALQTIARRALTSSEKEKAEQ